MTKEEIFDNYSHVDINELGQLKGCDYMDSNDFDKAAEEYAKQIAIDFAEWIRQNVSESDVPPLWYYPGEGEFTTAALFVEFLKQYNQ